MRGRTLWPAAVALFLAISGHPTPAGGSQALVIADFDDASQYAQHRNARGGLFEAWCISAECPQSERLREDALGRAGGGALRLTYSIDPAPHFNGWYTFLGADQSQGADLSMYDRIGFFARGTTAFTIEVKDRTSKDDGSPGGVAEYVVAAPGPAWKRVEIPFAEFRPKARRGVMDWSGIRQVVVVFSDVRSEREGSLTVDHLYAAHGTPAF